MNDIIKKYLSKDEIKNIEILKNSINNNKLTITCIGLYNHGKSTLLNALIDDFDLTTFKVADKRETAKNKKIEFNKFYYIDTPGLNAKENDDKRAFDAIKETDLVLFVHNAKTGEFHEAEIRLLKKIGATWSEPEKFLEKTIFVLSRIDELENENDDLEKLILKMQDQIKDIFNKKAKIIAVSANRYIKGKKENKNILIKKSKLLDLIQEIDKLKEKLSESFLKEKKQRLEKFFNSLIKRYISLIEEKKLQLSSIKREKEKFLSSLGQDIKKAENTLISKYKRLKEI